MDWDWDSFNFLFFSPVGLCVLLLFFLHCYIIIKNPKLFGFSFYTWYMFDGYMNLITIVNGFYLMKIPAFVSASGVFAFLFLNVDDLRVKISNLLSYHMAYVQWSTTTMISINRCSSTRFEKYWALRKVSWTLMFLICVLPFIDTHRTLYFQSEFILDVEQDNFRLHNTMNIWESFKYLVPVMCLCTSITTVAMMIWYKLTKNITNLSSQALKAERKIMYYVIVTDVVQLCATVLTVLRLIYPEGPTAKLLWQLLPIVSDCLSLMQPVLMTILSSAMRNEMLIMIGWKKTSVAPHAIPANFNNSRLSLNLG